MPRRRSVTAAIAAIAVTFAVTGCSLRPDHELEGLVKNVAPGAPRDCQWGSSNAEGEPDKWVDCFDSRRGSLTTVAEAVESRLSARGFLVSRVQRPHVVELIASRRGRALCVDVLERGFARGRSLAAGEVEQKTGEILLDVWATKPYSAAGECPAIPEFEEP